MRRETRVALAVSLVSLFSPALTLALDEAAKDILITDPVLLERMGVEADATNVYATPQALESLLLEPGEDAATQQALPEADRNAEPSDVFGTAEPGFTSLGAYAFRPYRSNQEWAARTTAYREIRCDGDPSSSPPRFIAELPELPHGAKLRRVHFWVYDGTTDADITMRVWRHCLPYADGQSYTSTLLGQRETALAGGQTWMVVPSEAGQLNEDVDTRGCVYSLWVDLGEAGVCDFNNLYLSKAAAEWIRQVSPPPGTATFDDVPTGHQFFQHIEALAASGITSGCDADSYCPNAPLTRGQMAVFLAKALGLHWGSF